MRSRTLYHAVSSDETLTEAWHSVRTQSSEQPGPDGVTLTAFNRRAFQELRALQDELRGGSYIPGDVKRIRLRKASGGERPLAILNVRDRIVQRAVLNVVGPLLDARFDDASCGFRPNRSVDTALNRATALVTSPASWIVRFDVKACFESIDLRRMRTDLRRSVDDRQLRRLIVACLGSASMETKEQDQSSIAGRESLVQGCPLSPLLANLYLDRFDRHARKAGLPIVRYADDVLLVAGSLRLAQAGLAKCEQFLRHLGLEINREKTLIQPIDGQIVFLGACLTWDAQKKKAVWWRDNKTSNIQERR